MAATTDFRYRSSEEILRENERTRAEIDATIAAIQERLSSAYWKARLLDGRAAVELFRRYPVPALLLTAGALWLAAAVVRDPASRRVTGPARPLPRERALARPVDVATARPGAVAVTPARERVADDIAAARRAAAR